MSKDGRRLVDCSGCAMPIYVGDGAVESLDTGEWWHARCSPIREYRLCSRCGKGFIRGEKVKPLGAGFTHPACVAADLRLDGLDDLAAAWEAAL